MRWRIRLLGTFCVEEMNASGGGRTLTRFRTYGAAATLAYIAYHRRGTTREALIEAIWPDCDLESGRNRLSIALSSLRRALALSPPEGPVLQAERVRVALDPTLITTDVAEFEAALQAASDATDIPERTRLLIRAADLYTGDLLPDFFEDWIRPARKRMIIRHLLALYELVGLLEKAEDRHRALSYALKAQTVEEAARTCLEGIPPDKDDEERLRVRQEAVKRTIRKWREKRSTDISRTFPDLPPIITPLIDREEPLKRLTETLRSEGVRLVTLTGAGGTGKTRLALEAAHQMRGEFPGGVGFASLASLADPALLLQAIAGALGLRLSPAGPPMESIVRLLNAGSSLLILDNFEPFGERGSEVVQALLGQCPPLRILVTSRQRLMQPEEWEIALSGLPAARGREPLAELIRIPGIELFLGRARMACPHFQVTPEDSAALGALSMFLHGNPLLLERAAARAGALSPTAILSRLSESVEAMRRRLDAESAPRGTLEREIEWRLDMLPPEAGELLAQFSIFRGSFSRAAVEAVCIGEPASSRTGRDTLSGRLDVLQARSLLDGPPGSAISRYQVPDPVRMIARKRVGRGEAETLARRHAYHFLDFLEEHHRLPPNTDGYLDVIEADHANLAAAFDYALSVHDFKVAARLVFAMDHYWGLSGRLEEGWRWSKQLVIHRQAFAPEWRLLILNAAGVLATAFGRWDGAQEWLGEALELAQASEERDMVAGVLLHLEDVAYRTRDYARAEALAAEALQICGELGRWEAFADGLSRMARLARARGAFREAQSHYEEALTVQPAGPESLQAAYYLHEIAGLLAQAGDPEGARTRLERSLTIRRQYRDRPGIAQCLQSLANLDS